MKKGSREALKVFDNKDASAQLKEATLEALCNELRQRLAILIDLEDYHAASVMDQSLSRTGLLEDDEIRYVAESLLSLLT